MTNEVTEVFRNRFDCHDEAWAAVKAQECPIAPVSPDVQHDLTFLDVEPVLRKVIPRTPVKTEWVCPRVKPGIPENSCPRSKGKSV
jgi:hypothetical protein